MTNALSLSTDQPRKLSKFSLPWWLHRVRGRSRPLAVGPLAALDLAPTVVAPSVISVKRSEP
jgi:hypothetical protein